MTAPLNSPNPSAPLRVQRSQIVVALSLAAATALSYLDRQTFPLVAGEVRREIPIDDVTFGQLGSLFLLAYGLMYAGGGYLIDRWGTRRGLALMVFAWSAANMATGFVTSLTGLAICRFMLGVGEGGGLPGAAKAVAEWFPAQKRAWAFGVFNTGAAAGAIIAAPLCAWLVAVWGWRAVFIVSGGLGVLWTIHWLATYRAPATVEVVRDVVTSPAALSYRNLLASPVVQRLMVAKLLTDSTWFFLIFWLPRYLADARGFDIKAIGAMAWIPFAFAAAGSMAGGSLGGQLMRRGMDWRRARWACLRLPALVMPLIATIAPAPLAPALAVYSLGMLAHQFWSVNLQTLAADFFPARWVASVGGLMGAVGALGGAAFGVLVGHLVGRGGYALPFLLAAVLHPISLFILRPLLRGHAPAVLQETTR